ncbi:YhcN/YlaJ family sporulation lipoprotein [Domibacillus aminovorans]|uniref:YhcN/YlaJ family sporulation lipoprotein n=1 Tax=Domibacillus aminovorans TaxID=29332 RepID=UPI003D1E8F1D
MGILKLFAIACLVTVALMGCNQNDKAVKDEAVDENVKTTTDDLQNHEKRVDVADKIAEQIVRFDDIENATVLVSERIAYVAVAMKDSNNEEITDTLKDKISDLVISDNSNIQKVFVSANPHFVSRMKDYGTKFREGKPVEGLFEEFNDTIGRVFPDAHSK